MSPRATPCLFLQLVLACSTADGLDTGSGDTGGPPDPPEPIPAPDGGSCGDGTFGWRTECEVYGQLSYQDPFDPDQYLELDPFVGPTFACCEGDPSQASADAACVDSCTRQLCDMAENIYDQIAHENGWNCGFGCEFDYDGCMAGIPVQQFPHPPFGDDYPHEVTVTCAATNVEPRNPDGTFAFIDAPVNFPYQDPALCGDPEGEAAGLQPLASLVANTALEDADTQAMATWWAPTGVGQERTSEVEAELAYAVRPCGDDDECLELTRLDASIPAGLHAGLNVQSASLSLVSVTEAPVVDRTGVFSFPAGSLHFVLTATVGGLPIAISRSNATAARGRTSRAADVFEVTDLRLTHEDPGFGADLRLDLVASHTNRAPEAIIRRLESPLDCDEPAAFQASSVDPDGDSMQHYWWTPAGMVQAPTAEVVLPAGIHFVVLVSVDPHGAHDATSLTYKRSCS